MHFLAVSVVWWFYVLCLWLCIVFVSFLLQFSIVCQPVSRVVSEVRVGMGNVAKEDLKWLRSSFGAVHVEVSGHFVYYG